MSRARADLGAGQGSLAIHGGIGSCLGASGSVRQFGLCGDVRGHEPWTSLLRRAQKGQPWIEIRLRYHAGVQEDFQHVPQ